MKRQPPTLSPERVASAHRAMDAHAKGWVQEGGMISRDESRAEALLQELRREPVHTSFDRVFPGMPPALKIG